MSSVDKVFLDYIEIGTADWNTEIEKPDNRVGISVDPVKFYVDKLPDKKGCLKINAAISNVNGNATVYYMSEDMVKKYDLPYWVRGCNCIDDCHPTVNKLLSDKGINMKDIVTSYDVPRKTLLNIMHENNVRGFYYLKIDTEGHDTVILKHFCSNFKDNEYLPHVIMFESNILTDSSEVKKTIMLLEQLGYDLVFSNQCDTALKLNLRKVNKNKFTQAIPKYYIMNYPANYDPHNLPHKNTLEDAKEYCIKNNCSGITYQYNRYEVRNGKYMNYNGDDRLLSWLYI